MENGKQTLEFIESLRILPILLHNIKKNYKVSFGKYDDLILTDKITKNKYLVEVSYCNKFIQVYRQEKPRQRVCDFKHYLEFVIEEVA